MLRADRLRGKKRRFFELIFSRTPPRSLAEAAKQAGYPPKDATAIAGHWLKQFRDLPEPMQALFVCDVLVLNGTYNPNTLNTMVRSCQYNHDRTLVEQSQKLLRLLDSQ